MKSVYILLTMSGTGVSKFMKFFVRSEFIHVSLSFDEDLKTSYSMGRLKVNNPWVGGFVEEHPDTGVFGKFNPWCEVLKLDIEEERYMKLKSDIEYLKENRKKYTYNYFGVPLIYFKIPHKLKRSFTCTQLVGTLLKRCNNELLRDIHKDVSLIISNDFYKVLEVISLYKGYLRDYVSSFG